jgi:surface antigen
VNTTAARGIRVRPVLFALLLALLTAGLVTVGARPALADTTPCGPDTAYSTCTSAGYTDHGYGALNSNSYWGMATGHECTNYVAYVEETVNGAPTPGYNLGNAGSWGTNASANGVTVNTTPAVGSVAWWTDGYHGASSLGHVAYVESVNDDGSITVSEDDAGSVGGFEWRTIAANSGYWPYEFIHFWDPTDLLVARVGNALKAKAGLTDSWSAEATDATDMAASGQRIAYLNTSGNLYAKDGVGGSWNTEVSGTTVDQYAVAPNLLIAREGSTLLGKNGLANSWSTLATDASNVEASGQRIAYLNTSGDLYAKDGLGATWNTEVTTFTVNQYVVTPDLLIVRSGNTLYGKGALTDSWATLATDATDVQAAGTRIAYEDTSGNIKVKNWLTDSWTTETSSVSQYTVTAGNYVLYRTSSDVYGKYGLNDSWTQLATTATDFKATYARFAWLTSSNELYAKDTLGGTAYDELGSVDQYVVS